MSARCGAAGVLLGLIASSLGAFAAPDREVVAPPELWSAPAWPEERGRIPADGKARVEALLDRFVEESPHAARATEARVRRALLRLEPLAGRDPRRARAELVAVTKDAPDDRWAGIARYALAALDEEEGELDQALDRYHRIHLESGDPELAARSAASIGRILLRRGRAGEAAGWLQFAVEREAGGETETGRLREMAVRIVLAEAGARAFWPPGELVEPDAGGEAGATVDPYGRIWAVEGGGIVCLAEGASHEVLASGELTASTPFAVDAEGRLFFADRRGDRVRVVEPGETAARLLRDRKGARITALVWDGATVVALESGTGRLVRLDASGDETVVAEGFAEAPVGASAARSGHVAVSDAKTGQVVLLSPEGRVVARSVRGAPEVTRSSRIVLGSDGALDVLDDRGARRTRLR